MQIEHDAGSANRAERLHAFFDFLMDDILHAQIEGKLQRFLLVLGIAQPLVEIFLDARLSFMIDADIAQHMREEVAERIDAALFGLEIETGNAEIVGSALLARREVALDPDETELSRESFLARSSSSRSGKTCSKLSRRPAGRRGRAGLAKSDSVASVVASTTPFLSTMSPRASLSGAEKSSSICSSVRAAGMLVCWASCVTVQQHDFNQAPADRAIEKEKKRRDAQEPDAALLYEFLAAAFAPYDTASAAQHAVAASLRHG